MDFDSLLLGLTVLAVVVVLVGLIVFVDIVEELLCRVM